MEQNGLFGVFAQRYFIREICITIERDPQNLSQKLTLNFMQEVYRVLKGCFPEKLKGAAKLYSTYY